MKRAVPALFGIIISLCLFFFTQVVAGQKSDSDVNSSEVRKNPALRPSEHLLFSGWGLTPAGHQIPVSDLPLKMIVAPDKQALIAVHGGFNEHGVTIVDVARQAQSQFLPLAKAFNGLVFSSDGKRFFVSGGDSGEIHEFSYAGGKANCERSIKLSSDESDV